MIKVLRYSFQQGFGQWRAVSIAWSWQTAVALTLGLQTHQVLEASIGNSLEINRLSGGFDHTVLLDFLQTHGASITPLLGQLRWWVLLWWVASVFLNGGLLTSAVEGAERTWRAFWVGGARFFFPFLKISSIFWLKAIVWSVAVLLPAAIFFEPSLRYFSTEIYTVWGMWGMLVVWLLGLVVLFLWSLASRWHKMQFPTASIWQCWWEGGKSFLQKKRQLLGWIATTGACLAILWATFWLFEKWWSATFPTVLLPLLLAQQGFAWLKIWLRLVVFAGTVLRIRN